MKVYAVFTGRSGFDLDLDVIEHTAIEAHAHARELRQMGCENVKVKEFADEEQAYDWFEARR